MRIAYVVIALTRSQAREIAGRLDQNDPLARWLAQQADTRYGDIPDDWKPFDAHRIEELLGTTPRVYESRTLLVESVLHENLTNLFDGLLDAGVDVYFIDALATMLQPYSQFAQASDAFLAATKKCVLIFPGLPEDALLNLRQQCAKTWRSVYAAYEKGRQHRVISADLPGFLNYVNQLKGLPEYAVPGPGVIAALSRDVFNSEPRSRPQL